MECGDASPLTPETLHEHTRRLEQMARDQEMIVEENRKRELDEEGEWSRCVMCGVVLGEVGTIDGAFVSRQTVNGRFCRMDCVICYLRSLCSENIDSIVDRVRDTHEVDADCGEGDAILPTTLRRCRQCGRHFDARNAVCVSDQVRDLLEGELARRQFYFDSYTCLFAFVGASAGEGVGPDAVMQACRESGCDARTIGKEVFVV